ncbi:MAG: magnesium transporter [Proteobacteria bacterium]|jgi:magnesium transporter|nr:magnesium transporter [Pseudomonadota bacterium]
MAELNQRTDAILRRLVRRDARQSLRKVMAKSRPEDVAAAMEHLTYNEQKRLFRMVEESEYAAEILANMGDDGAQHVVTGMDEDQLVTLLEYMDPDDATDLVAVLPVDVRVRVLAALGESDDATEVRSLLAWPSDSAGGIMSPQVFKVHHLASCGDAIRALQQSHEELETVFYLYVMDDYDKLVGVTSLRSVLTHPANTPIKHVMGADVISVSPLQDQEEVARVVARYDLMAVPVVDEDRRLLGIVTVDDVVDVIREEAAEDMMRMAGVDEDADLANRSVLHQARHRAFWLMATIIGGVAMAEIVGQFEESLQKVAILAGFIPVIMGMGGNVGIQSATIAVRGLATGHVQIGGALSFIWREARVGILLGILFGLMVGGYGLLRFYDQPMLGPSVALSIMLAIMLAGMLGASIPILLDRLGVDPAIATGPFVTTGVDIIGVIIYFNVAKLLMGI